MSPARKSEPEPLPQIPGYRVEGVLGRGSTGTVYRAVQQAVDRVVALKVLHPALSKGRIARRLQREARTTARLSHPNLVAAIDMGSINGLWWYAMEFVDGPSLAARLRKERQLSEREALRLFIPLCEALEHLHQNGVVHRDIKPGNILVDQTGRARLVDLGLAFAEDDPAMTSQGGTLGTPHYVSPEQARNPVAADVRSDIWSLGASLYHTVCARPPFAGESVADILSAVLYARVPDPGELAPSLSRGMRLVLRKCLSRDPARRYQTPEDLVDDLERMRERRQVTVRRSALEPSAGHEERMRRWWTGAGLGVVIALTAVVLVWRPWSSALAPASSTQAASHDATETLSRQARAGPRMLATVLSGLDQLRPEVPPEFMPRWRQVRGEVSRLYDAEVEKLLSAFKDEFARLLEKRSFVAAGELLDGFHQGVRTQLNTSPEQQGKVVAEARLEERRAQLDQAVDQAVKDVRRLLGSHYQKVVRKRVEGQIERGLWRAAREVLLIDLEVVLADARIAISGLPPGELQAVLDRFRAELVTPDVDDLNGRWTELDRTLRTWVEGRAAELEEQLARRTEVDVADRLLADWEAHLEVEHLVPGEMLTEYSNLGQLELGVAERKLRSLEADAVASDARDYVEAERAQLAPLWGRRDFTELALRWDQVLALSFLEVERDVIELQLDEARLLAELLDRAAARLEQLAEERAEADFVVGSIGVRGHVLIDEDPRRAAFRLSPSAAAAGGRDIRLGLVDVEGAKMVLAAELEQLAGLAEDPEAPVERLMRGLFRMHEGDVAAAQAMLPVGDLGDARLEALATELGRRVSESLAELDQTQRQRLAEAERLERLVYRIVKFGVVHPREVENTVARIDRLLTEFGDLDFVRERAVELKYLKRTFSQENPISEQTFREAFGASEVELDPQQHTVRMTLALDAQALGGPGDPGDWIVAPDGEGWVAPGPSSRKQLADEYRWPRLTLHTPMDLEQRLAAEVRIEQLRESGPPRFLLVTVAGVHVGLATGERGEEGRWLAGSGGPEHVDALAEALLEKGEGRPFQGLTRGSTHVIRVELTQGRGRASIHLDGELLGIASEPRPLFEPGSASIGVRSLEVLRFISVEVEGGYSQ